MVETIRRCGSFDLEGGLAEEGRLPQLQLLQFQPFIELQLGSDHLLPIRGTNRCLVQNTKELRKGNEVIIEERSAKKKEQKRGTDMNALLIDAQIELESYKEEHVRAWKKGQTMQQ